MEEDLKDIELFIDFCRAPYNFEHESEEKSYKELSDKIEYLIKAYKEDEAVIEEMANEIFIEHNPHFKTTEEVIEYFKNKVKENKE